MTAIETASRPLSEADHRAQLRRAVIASAVGTAIEWYDFQLYNQAAALVFGKLFFPRSDPLVGVMQAFGVYFVGYLAARSARRFSVTSATASGARRHWSRRC
jgi:hypothetical protein